MIRRFLADSALLVVDAQRGVNVHSHWGGSEGHRNNPDAEARIRELLCAWRAAKRPVYFTLHNSREENSPLKLALPSGKPIPGLEAEAGEDVVVKDVNSGFIGTDLELRFRRAGIRRIVVAGFFTNMCVETTVRMAGNLGFDTYLAHDACAAGNRRSPEGSGFDADTVHRMSVANMHAEYCTALTSEILVGLLKADAEGHQRVQGNEQTSGAVDRS